MNKNSAFFLSVLMIFTGLSGCVKVDPQLVSFRNDLSIQYPPIPDKDQDSIPEPVPDMGMTNGPLLTDIEGNIYKTIHIGTQTWMAENLKTTMYNDSSIILQGTGAPAGYTSWFDIGEGAYCWYENDLRYKDEFGALYNWHGVETKKLCPSGWHVPNAEEWTTLIDYLGNKNLDSGSLLASATNESGFSAVDAGELSGWGFLPSTPAFWTALDGGERYPVPKACLIIIWTEGIRFGYEPQSFGYCVRCVKD
jgi:uncharacterized protein (TIGR02145 family)